MNILFFGPNGSGKGTQGAILKERYAIPHIESGALFRDHMSRNSELGREAEAYIRRGELVPDSITIPMILDRLQLPDCEEGWLVDGFPRNPNQAVRLDEALEQRGLGVDIVVEIVLDRRIAKNRIMGRRICVNDPNHPNNVFIDAIMPDGDRCRVCGGELRSRPDDQDEPAIDKRHDIYYDAEEGTLAAVHYFRRRAEEGDRPRVLAVDGRPGVDEVTAELVAKL